MDDRAHAYPFRSTLRRLPAGFPTGLWARMTIGERQFRVVGYFVKPTGHSL